MAACRYNSSASVESRRAESEIAQQAKAELRLGRARRRLVTPKLRCCHEVALGERDLSRIGNGLCRESLAQRRRNQCAQNGGERSHRQVISAILLPGSLTPLGVSTSSSLFPRPST